MSNQTQLTVLEDYKVEKKGISKKSNEYLVNTWNEVQGYINQLEAIKKTIRPELFKRANKCAGKSYKVGTDKVMIIYRPNYLTVNLSFARKKHAVKEIPDKDILAPFWEKTKGLKLADRIKVLPGLTVTEFVTIK